MKKSRQISNNSRREELEDPATSDGSSKISLQGSKKAATVSLLAVIIASIIYGVASTGISYVNKKIFKSQPNLSPLNVLMVQCFMNVLTCLTLMSYKEVKKTAFHSLKKYGITIPELNKLMEK